MSYFLIITVLLTVERSSAQLDGDPPPLPVTGENIIKNINFIIMYSHTIGVRLYLCEEVRLLPDFSMIAARQFHDDDQNSPGSDSSDDLNDGVWCQSANSGSMIGTWYLPDGTQVCTVDYTNFPLHVFHVTDQIRLLRDLGITSYQGLYSCIIPNENKTNQTLWVGIYGNSNFDSSGKSVWY